MQYAWNYCHCQGNPTLGNPLPIHFVWNDDFLSCSFVDMLRMKTNCITSTEYHIDIDTHGTWKQFIFDSLWIDIRKMSATISNINVLQTYPYFNELFIIHYLHINGKSMHVSVLHELFSIALMSASINVCHYAFFSLLITELSYWHLIPWLCTMSDDEIKECINV